jgi:DNA excision repair protein ERCC-5
MGVNGLWQVVQPCARPTNLATLNRKRLAVDASIWIYQFLKAVRDKEGNALHNSHVVGFFRRICKLLWYGINPVFVFDGGAPMLKRQTILNRKQRREGRREDAVRTAGKLLAVQMQRIAEEEDQKRKRNAGRGSNWDAQEEPQEEIPSADKLVYADEVLMSQQERMRSRKFHKQDAYHLPEIDHSIADMGQPNDPRIMSMAELEEYARQFHSGEDINLYDFSKIDFNGDFFKSLPPADRYNILSAARVRSRLRMGLSKDQLDEMFPDRMAFSRFQIERVKERNHLTQRLMLEIGMGGLDLTISGGRVAGEKNREYILVKNEGVEGGWALGVVSKEKDVGEIHNPIDVDALQFQYQTKDENSDVEDEEFEDVPVEGLNRLPKPSSGHVPYSYTSKHEGHREDDSVAKRNENEDSLFVGGDPFGTGDDLFGEVETERLYQDEEDDIRRAIAISLQNQHESNRPSAEEELEFEDVDIEGPVWEQKAVQEPKPIMTTSGKMVAHIVNNRSSAAVPRRRRSDASSGSDDFQAVLAASRKMKKAQPAPAVPNMKNPFDGPLPFPKLQWGPPLFNLKPDTPKKLEQESNRKETAGFAASGSDEDLAGGFEKDKNDAGPRPLPPWLVEDTDIRESLKKQQEMENEINAEDRAIALEEERDLQRRRENDLIEIMSSSDDDSDLEVIESFPAEIGKGEESLPESSSIKSNTEEMIVRETRNKSPSNSPVPKPQEVEAGSLKDSGELSVSPEPEFTDVLMPDGAHEDTIESAMTGGDSTPNPTFEDSAEMDLFPNQDPGVDKANIEDDIFGDSDRDDFQGEFSDPEDEELLNQMEEEAEEHARFVSELNNKSTQENKELYEKELRALRAQQKKDRRDADEVTQIMVTECQSLLRLFGIPYITAPMEAEAQCAELVHLGLVDGVVTDDSDIFLFGGTRVYKNMFNNNKFVECYLNTDLEKELSLSREQLISLAQLLGSDYTDGLPGVGPVTAIEILSEFPGADGLEKFREWWQEVQSQARPKEADTASPFRKKFRRSQATKLFLPPAFPSSAVKDAYLMPEVDRSKENFQWGVPDVEGLRQFLMATIGWSKERTDEVLVPVIKDMNKRDREGTQSNITRYFQGGTGSEVKEVFAPRQRTKGSKRMAEAVGRLRAHAEIETPSTDEAASIASKANKKRKTRTNVIDDERDEFPDEDIDEYLRHA